MLHNGTILNSAPIGMRCPRGPGPWRFWFIYFSSDHLVQGLELAIVPSDIPFDLPWLR